jgi:hypothetical protein
MRPAKTGVAADVETAQRSYLLCLWQPRKEVHTHCKTIDRSISASFVPPSQPNSRPDPALMHGMHL